MTADVWLNRVDHFRPGAELFRSDRTFQVQAYAVSHSQMLLSSRRGADGKDCETTIEVLFKPVEAVQIQECYRGLVITCATEAEAKHINADISDYGYRAREARTFVLSSEGVRGYVVSCAIGWREGVLPRMQPSLFHPISSFDSVWPTGPLADFSARLNAAAPAEIVQVLAAGLDDNARRDRHRYIHVLLAKGTQDDDRRTVGVFLTETDAQQAAELLRPHVVQCWIEEAPMLF